MSTRIEDTVGWGRFTVYSVYALILGTLVAFDSWSIRDRRREARRKAPAGSPSGRDTADGPAPLEEAGGRRATEGAADGWTPRPPREQLHMEPAANLAARGALDGILPTRWTHLAQLIFALNGLAVTVYLGVFTVVLTTVLEAEDASARVDLLALMTLISPFILVPWRLYAHYLDDAIAKMYPVIIEAAALAGLPTRLHLVNRVYLAPPGLKYLIPVVARQDRLSTEKLATNQFKGVAVLDLAFLERFRRKSMQEAEEPASGVGALVLRQLAEARLGGYRGHYAVDLFAGILMIVPVALMYIHGLWEGEIVVAWAAEIHRESAVAAVSAGAGLLGLAVTTLRWQRDPTVKDLRGLGLAPCEREMNAEYFDGCGY